MQLFYFSLAFFSISFISLLFIINKKLEFAIHIILVGYLIGFTISPLFELYYLSSILTYPVIVTNVIFFSRNRLIRIFYVLLCFFASLFLIYQFKSIDFTSIQPNYVIEVVIVAGLLISLFIIGYYYFAVIFKYQDEIEKSEILLQNKNTELKKYIDSNMQLENFAHLASHELKTPLRNITNLSQFLSTKLDDQISDQQKEMFELINSQVEEMGKLIKDLFELSSVSNEPMEVKPLDLPVMIDSLINNDFLKQKKWITVKKLPNQIIGHNIYIKEVFRNLLSNALKFISHTTDPKIVIDCKEKTEEFQFSVIDNGIGISKQKRDKVFLIFKRLHNKTEYEGTGIGLAICKKIIERHQGKIWIEDNSTGGSVFKFTIAKNII